MVAVLLGWALVGETVTAGTLAGAVVILSGVALITRGSAAKPPPHLPHHEPARQPPPKPPQVAEPQLVRDRPAQAQG